VSTERSAVSGLDAPAAASVAPARPLLWSIKRELWEHRSIYLAPLAVAALFLLGFALSVVLLPGRMRAAALDPVQQHQVMVGPYDMVAGLMMLTGMIVGTFYCLDALYGERRDRAILFWKSLPVSDRTAVLAKASIPLLVLPLVAFAITVALQFLMLLVHSAALAASGQGVGTLWSELSLFRRSVLLLYHLLAVHSLLHAPFYAWMLLVSAWASRVPLLWAFLPPIAICAFENLAFNTMYLAGLLLHQLDGSSAAMPMSGSMPTDATTHVTLGLFLSSPGLWLGLLATALFLALAVRLRRSRGPI
jgi:ABC-2 type transport system permease protein